MRVDRHTEPGTTQSYQVHAERAFILNVQTGKLRLRHIQRHHQAET